MPITLLIADEFEVMRAGLKSIVAGSGIKIIAEASTGTVAVRLTLKHKPDVSMLGVSMPEGDGLTRLSAHRRRLRTSNMLERLNKEIHRRTRVATLFPNEASLLRLVSAVLAEVDEEWQTGKRYLNTETD